MAKRDLYAVLGVGRQASEQEIRKAYRELARKHHPDRNPGSKDAEDKFKEASYAREVLLNKGKRALYDEFGELGLREGFDPEMARRYTQRSAGGGEGGGPRGFGRLEDLLREMAGAQQGGASWGGPFQDMFGGDVETVFGHAAGKRSGGGRGREVVADVSVSFVEALRGAERELTLQVPGEAPRLIKVRIPAGVRDQGKVRLRGQGQAGGDLVLKVHVEEHAVFSRRDDDLLLTVPVTVSEAMHGAKVQIPTLDGPVALQIPKGVQSGARLRLKGKGVRRGAERGDLIATVQVVLPPLSPELESAVDALEQRYPGGIREGLEL